MPLPPDVSHEELVRRLNEIFKTLALMLNGMEIVQVREEPQAPRNGLIVIADGTTWDPGSGAGIYAYFNDAWNKMA